MLAPGLGPLGRDPIEDAQSLTAVYAETLLNPSFPFCDERDFVSASADVVVSGSEKQRLDMY